MEQDTVATTTTGAAPSNVVGSGGNINNNGTYGSTIQEGGGGVGGLTGGHYQHPTHHPPLTPNDPGVGAPTTTTTTTAAPVDDEYRNNGDGITNPDDEDDEGYDMSLSELLYSAASYHAIAKPVSFTMILAALSVIFINTEQSIRQGEEVMAAAYTVWNVQDSNESTGKTLAMSLGNSLIIVTVICAMTFVIVLLYKFRCMKCLIGYMVLSSATLLGVLGGTMFDVAIDKYRLPIDVFSFYFFLFNFGIVGTIAVFFQLGVPPYITQGYLVATSVIMAWQLSHFDPWTTWTLLVMLALYDLCAVLTPCGPLKALVHLMSQEDSPDMPGLLYEAELPGGAQRPVQRGRSNVGSGGGSGEGGRSDQQQQRQGTNSGGQQQSVARAATAGSGESEEASAADDDRTDRSDIEMTPASSSSAMAAAAVPRSPSRPESSYVPLQREEEEDRSNHNAPTAATAAGQQQDVAGGERTAIMPLAIAKLYRLPLVSPLPTTTTTQRKPKKKRNNSAGSNDSNVSTSPLLEDGSSEGGSNPPSPTSIHSQSHTPSELRSDVEVLLPRTGGRIDKKQNGQDGKPRYVVTDRNGVVKRTLVVDRRGRVFEELEDEDDDDDSEGGGRFSNSIKLGLGDFIFYSVLVAKAALYSFATFAACMLVILAGLGGTLVLLAVYHQALPALPISIFLGVTFYLLTRLLIEPWIEDMLRTPYYV